MSNKNATIKIAIIIATITLLLVIGGLVFFVTNSLIFIPQTIYVSEILPTLSQSTPSEITISTPTPLASLPTINPTELSINTLTPETTQVRFPVADFSLSNINTIPPDDIMQEIQYYGGGGGDGECPKLSTPDLYLSKESYWASGIDVRSCGWQPNEQVAVTLIYPDDQSEQEIVKVFFDGSLISNFRSVKMPVGQYRVQLIGDSGQVSGTTNLVLEGWPTLYGGEELFLSGFNENEDIRLFLFESKTTRNSGQYMLLIGWKQYQVSNTGQLVIHVPFKYDEFFNCNYFYYVVGSVSGYVSNSLRRCNPDIETILTSACGTMKSRLHIGDSARVAYVNGSKTRIREYPGFSQSIVSSVAEGTEVELINRECYENTVWWNITINNIIGWMAEYQDNTYFLEPLSE